MTSPAPALLRKAAAIDKPTEAVLRRAVLDDLGKTGDLSADTRSKIIRRLCFPTIRPAKTQLDWVRRAVSTDDARPHLMHPVETVRNSRHELAAIDGRRLHVIPQADPPPPGVPRLPAARAVDAAGSALDEVSFPDYRRIIPVTARSEERDLAELEWATADDRRGLVAGFDGRWFDAAHVIAAANGARFTYEANGTPTGPAIIRPHAFPDAFAVLVPVRLS